MYVPEYQGIVATPKAMECQGGVDQCQRWTLRLFLQRLWIVFGRFDHRKKALPTFSSLKNYRSDQGLASFDLEREEEFEKKP